MRRTSRQRDSETACGALGGTEPDQPCAANRPTEHYAQQNGACAGLIERREALQNQTALSILQSDRFLQPRHGLEREPALLGHLYGAERIDTVEGVGEVHGAGVVRRGRMSDGQLATAVPGRAGRRAVACSAAAEEELVHFVPVALGRRSGERVRK
jgi:hypothetical protein